MNDVVSHALVNIVGVSSQVILVPLYIRNFGENGYSFLAVIFSISAFILASDYGVYMSASAEINRIFRSNNYFSFTLWRDYSKYVIKTSGFLALILCLYFWYSSYNNRELWVYSELDSMIFIIFLISSSMSLVQHADLIKYQVREKFGKGLKTLATIRLVEASIQGLILYLGANLVLYTFTTFLLKLLATLLFSSLARRNLNFPKLDEHEPAVFEKEFLKFRVIFRNSVFHFANLLNLHGTILIASIWIQPNSLFLVLIARMITSPVRFFAESVIHGGLPRLTVYFASNARLNYQIRSVSIKSALILGGFVLLVSFSLISIAIGPILWRYLSFGNIDYQMDLIMLFLVATFLDSISAILAMMGIAKNKGISIQLLFLGSTFFALLTQLIFQNFLDYFAIPIAIISGNLVFFLISKILHSRDRLSL